MRESSPGSPAPVAGSLPYQSELDGLRGVAILAVLLHHLRRGLLDGGYVGVDVFFVLSGYLITSVVRHDIAAGTFRFGRFYSRRMKRLLPAATVMAAVVLVLGTVLFLPKELAELGQSVAAYSSLASNVLFWRRVDYFTGQSSSWPLLHTWSLAIEEQFYLVFPLVLWSMRRRRPSTQAMMLLVAFLASLAVSIWQSRSHDHARAAYYLLPSRAWEMLIGAVCAYAPRRTMTSGSGALLGLCGAALIVVPMLGYDENTPFPGVAALAPTVGTTLLIYVLRCGNAAWAKLLSWKPLVSVGLMSYSLYLWHWPLLVLARYPWSGRPSSCPSAVPVVACAACFFVSWLSYRFVESPWRRASIADGRILSLGILVSVLTALAGLLVARGQGFPGRLPDRAVRYAAAATDFGPHLLSSTADVRSGRLPTIGVNEPDTPPAFAIWGDSHANSIAPAFDALARDRGLAGVVIAHAATAPLEQIGLVGYVDGSTVYASNDDFRRAAIERVRAERFPVVLLVGRWTALLDGEYERDGVRVTSIAEKESIVSEALAVTTRDLMAHGARQVWLITEVPTQPFNVPKHLALREFLGYGDVTPVTREQYRESTERLNRVLARAIDAGLRVYDIQDAFFDGADGIIVDHDHLRYCDHTHLSLHGANAIAEVLAPLFDAILPADVRDAPPDGG